MLLAGLLEGAQLRAACGELPRRLVLVSRQVGLLREALVGEDQARGQAWPRGQTQAQRRAALLEEADHLGLALVARLDDRQLVGNAPDVSLELHVPARVPAAPPPTHGAQPLVLPGTAAARVHGDGAEHGLDRTHPRTAVVGGPDLDPGVTAAGLLGEQVVAPHSAGPEAVIAQ